MRRTIGLAAGLMLAFTSTLSPAWGVASIPFESQTAADPVKPPPVKSKKSKDTLTLDSTDKHVNDRLTEGEPQKHTNRKSGSKPKDTQAGSGKPAAPKSKDDSTTDISRRGDLKLNTGICGRPQNDGTVPGPDWCQPVIPEEWNITATPVPRPATPRPEDVTWEQVRSESKDVTFPRHSVKVQPAGRTLVNLDTIVYTDDSKLSTTTVTLLGFPVVVEATAISYTWRFGDGSPALTTSSPGSAYPSKEITHKYMKRGDVSLTVTTNYAARFNVADTGWQYVAGTIPVTGPATALRVREAVPVLVDPDR